MKVTRISPNIGAIITDLSLKDDLTPERVQDVRSLFFEYEVIFFKEQAPLSETEYLAMVKKLFEPTKHPFISEGEPIVPGISPFQPYPGIPEITGIRHGAKNKGNLNEWHSDLNWLENPSLGSVLRAMVLPSLGGNTMWASMTAAYRDLDDETKAQIENLRVYHDFTQIYRGCFAGNPEALAAMQRQLPRQAHPLVLTHPVTGKKAIFANRVSSTGIEGMDPEQSKALLNKLYHKASIPEYQVRYKWDVNDVAMWDNLSTQHYAISDYWPEERRMERISLAGIKIKK